MLAYLELPINIGYRIPLESFAVTLKAGPYLAYGLSAKLKGEDDGDSAEIDLYKKRDEFGGEPLLKKFDYGLGIGAGIEFGQIAVGLSYELGLANLNATKADGSISNQNAYLSVGYKF
ncbi:MAG: PorT family protein [Prevotella sp.]|nr:PorT family protein [Prevotella sp.]